MTSQQTPAGAKNTKKCKFNGLISVPSLICLFQEVNFHLLAKTIQARLQIQRNSGKACTFEDLGEFRDEEENQDDDQQLRCLVRALRS